MFVDTSFVSEVKILDFQKKSTYLQTAKNLLNLWLFTIQRGLSLNIQLSIHAFYGGGISVADPGFCSQRVKNLLFSKNFDENCLKMNEIGPRGGRRVPSAPLDPPMHLIT